MPRKRTPKAPPVAPVPPTTSPEPAPTGPEVVDLSKLTDQELWALCWRAGVLEHLLADYQVEIYRSIKADLWGEGGYSAPTGKQSLYVLEICRRWGKSFLCAVIAFELCLRKPKATVYWAAETAIQVRTILDSVLQPLLNVCPPDLAPRIVPTQGRIFFQNGSKIILRGCEDIRKANKLRGDGADLFIIDEAGSIDVLDYVFASIASFMVLRTNGRILIPSTPARTPAHPFTKFCIEAESGGKGGFARRNCHQAKFSEQKLKELAELLGGTDTADWRREALCERVVDSDLAIVPEFSEPGADHAITLPYCTECGIEYELHDTHEAACPKWTWEYQLPEYRDTYVGIDWGHFPDFTALVFCSYDFAKGLLVVEGEAELSKQSTTQIADCIRDNEQRLWGELWKNPGVPQDEKPYRRVSDTDPRTLHTLDTEHGIWVMPSRRDDKEAAVNALRLAVQRRQLRIHPSCARMIANLKAGLWKPRRGQDRRTFDRIKGFGHFDLIDALVFAHRNTDPSHNPFPPTASHMDGWKIPGQAPSPQVPNQFKDLASQFSHRHSALFPGIKR